MPEANSAANSERPARLLPIATMAALVLVYGYFLAHPLDLTTGDLGRHLKNGELFVQNRFVAQTNLYSYTFPDQPFVNHHWGSGVIFYLIERAFGFEGLSLASIALSVVTFLIFFAAATKSSSFAVAAPLAVVAIPVLITRYEMRPELFSYLLGGIFLYILRGYQRQKLGLTWLFLLPLLEMIWVNLHIYFFFGIALIGAHLCEAAVAFFADRSQDHFVRLKGLATAGVLAAAAACFNPAGIEGALYPFFIFNEYQFPVIENYSVFAVLNAGYQFFPLPYFLIQFGLLWLSWIYVATRRRADFSLANFLLSVFFSVLAWWFIRNFALFAYFALPLTAANFQSLSWGRRTASFSYAARRASVAAGLAAAVLVLINPDYFFSGGRGAVGLGLKKGNHAAAEFFRSEKLQGPIYNNYDVGGYLIYHLYPQHKVFVDNRPETYPAAFFNDVYFALQTDETQWLKISHQFGFNVIVFNHRDRSSLGEQFIVRRVLDPAWAPVFFDSDILILLKRFGPNQPTIEKNELPKEKILSPAN
ncbi:MAG TPA: hypothetical protein VEI95_03115 [Acidobacteriota bacterium]|nr:hypothetical protein [Acidobacteriota bacterium]